MRIVALTDIHGRKSYVKYLSRSIRDVDYDLVVIAGDLTYFSKFSEAVNLLKYLYEKLEKTILFIPGNCDDSKLLDIEYIDNDIVNIHDCLFTYRNLFFYGVGGSGKTPFNTWIEWSEDDFERFINKVRSIDRDRLILITHNPIYSIMDYVNGVYTGSRVLYDFLNTHGALLWVTGHIHEYSGSVIVNKTTIVNPGPFVNGYYALISIGNNKVEVSIHNFLEERRD